MPKTKRAPSRQERAEFTKETLQAKALKLFREAGFEATSVEAICRASGVSKGAFYAHYKSKYSLIQEYIDSLDMNYRKQFEALPAGRKASFVLPEFIDVIAITLENRLSLDLLRVVYKAEVSREISIDPFVSKCRDLYRVIQDILDRGKQDGSFRSNLDGEKVSAHIVMAIRGMVFEWCSRAPSFDFRKELAAHMEILISGIQTPGASMQRR